MNSRFSVHVIKSKISDAEPFNSIHYVDICIPYITIHKKFTFSKRIIHVFLKNLVGKTAHNVPILGNCEFNKNRVPFYIGV